MSVYMSPVSKPATAIFGFIVSSIGGDFGMHVSRGTQGVGRAATRAVVFSSVLIIVADFLISRTMISIFGQ